MKKYILSILSLLFLNTINSQVLYDETFDNYTLGNLGTDVTGVIPGQGGWHTLSANLPPNYSNNNYRIVNELNKGKVLEISSTPTNHAVLIAFKSLSYNINQRTPGNNVIKFQIDFYPGYQANGNTQSRSEISLLSFGSFFDLDYKKLYTFNFNVHNGTVVSYDISSPGYLSFNAWYRVIMYLDYDNKKAYLEIPNAGSKVFVFHNFLADINSSNTIEDFYPATILLYNTVDSSGGINNAVHSKYDNIKITALNAVPPHILSATNFLSEKFNLYPNPATNVVNITNSENYLVNQVVIYDVAGKELSTQTFNNESEIQLNVENLASGVYLLHMQTDEGTAVKKLVKK